MSDNKNKNPFELIYIKDYKKFLEENSDLKAKEGNIKVLEIQGENAKRMMIQDYLRGNPVGKFEVFE